MSLSQGRGCFADFAKLAAVSQSDRWAAADGNSTEAAGWNPGPLVRHRGAVFFFSGSGLVSLSQIYLVQFG